MKIDGFKYLKRNRALEEDEEFVARAAGGLRLEMLCSVTSQAPLLAVASMLLLTNTRDFLTRLLLGHSPRDECPDAGRLSMLTTSGQYCTNDWSMPNLLT